MAFVDLDFEPREARDHLYGWRIPQAIDAYSGLLAKANNELEIAYFQQRLAQALFRTFDLEKALALHCTLKSPAGDTASWDVEWLVVWQAYCGASMSRGSRWLGHASVSRAETMQRLMERVKIPSEALVFEYVLATVTEAGRMNSGLQAFENEVAKARLVMRLARDPDKLPLNDIEAMIASERFLKSWEPRQIDKTVAAMAEANPQAPYWQWAVAVAYQEIGRGGPFVDKVAALGTAFEMSEALAEAYPDVVRFQRTRAEVAGQYAEALGQRDPKRSAEIYGVTRKKVESLAARHPLHPGVWDILERFHYNFCTWRIHRLEDDLDGRQRALEEQMNPAVREETAVQAGIPPTGVGFEITAPIAQEPPSAPFDSGATSRTSALEATLSDMLEGAAQ